MNLEPEPVLKELKFDKKELNFATDKGNIYSYIYAHTFTKD